jgi:hypothetical protein
MAFVGFELEDMQRLLPARTREALSHAAKGLRRLPKQVSQGLRKSLQLNIMNMALWQSLCVLAQIVCFVAEEELSFYLLFVDYDRKEGGDYRHDDVNWSETPVMQAILALQILFSVATIASVHFAIQYHIVKRQQHAAMSHISAMLVETKWTVCRRVFPEVLLLILQIPPGIDSTFSESNFTGNTAVHRVRVFNCMCFLRMCVGELSHVFTGKM